MNIKNLAKDCALSIFVVIVVAATMMLYGFVNEFINPLEVSATTNISPDLIGKVEKLSIFQLLQIPALFLICWFRCRVAIYVHNKIYNCKNPKREKLIQVIRWDLVIPVVPYFLASQLGDMFQVDVFFLFIGLSAGVLFKGYFKFFPGLIHTMVFALWFYMGASPHFNLDYGMLILISSYIASYVAVSMFNNVTTQKDI